MFSAAQNYLINKIEAKTFAPIILFFNAIFAKDSILMLAQFPTLSGGISLIIIKTAITKSSNLFYC